MGTIGSGCGHVVVVKSKRGMEAATMYENELDAVLAMVDSGSFGGGNSYGCDKHQLALRKVETKQAEIWNKIADDMGATGCKTEYDQEGR